MGFPPLLRGDWGENSEATSMSFASGHRVDQKMFLPAPGALIRITFRWRDAPGGLEVVEKTNHRPGEGDRSVREIRTIRFTIANAMHPWYSISCKTITYIT